MISDKDRQRLHTVITALEKAAHGDYSSKLNREEEKDEITILAETVTELLRNIKEKELGSQQKSVTGAQQQEEKYRTILDIMDQGYFENDLSGRVTFANGAACRFLGMPLEQLTGMSYRDYLSEDSANALYAACNKVYRTGEPIRLNHHEIIRKDGDVASRNLYIDLTRNHEGKPTHFRTLVLDVTEETRYRKVLIESQKKYRNVLSSMKEAYLETDLAGNYIFFNDALCKILGYSRKELENANYRLVTPPDHIESTYRMYNELFRTGHARFYTDYEMLAKDGSIVHAEMFITLMRSPTGEPIGFCSVGRDVTDKIKARRAIEASDRRMRLITDNVREIIWTMDFNLNLTYLSTSVFRVTGFTHDQIMAIPVKSFLPPKTYQYLRQLLAEELAIEESGDAPDAERTQTIEMPLLKKDGTVFWAEISLEFNRDETGRAFEIIGVTRDITERRNMTEKLKQSEQRFRMIVENMREVIWTTDLDLNYTYVSPSCEFLTGYSPEEIMAIPVDEIVTEESFRAALSTIEDEITLEHSGAVTDPHRSRSIVQEVYCKHGGTIWMDVTATFIRNEEGLPTGMLMAGRDITARKITEDEKTKLEEQLIQAQKMETVGRLAGGVAHDFNNMLNVILGYVDLARLRLAAQHPVVKDIAEIEKAAIRSRNIAGQLLAFSRKQVIEPKIVNLNEMISYTEKALIHLIGEHIELSFRPEENLQLTRIDPSQLEQILMNLAVNARDAMPDGGTLIINTDNVNLDESYGRGILDFKPGSYVRICVTDNGTGMDKETLKHIFEPFYTSKETGKGTGLGLATVYGIVKQNNGFVNVYSEPGQGTSFNIYLPQTDEEEDIPEAETSDLSKGSGTILLVEDDAMVLEVTRHMLEELGYSVIDAQDPHEALRLHENNDHHIDLVITDVIMPAMSGKELRDSLASGNPNVRILFISGYTADVIARHGILDKGVQFLQKPFTLKELGRKVHQLMSDP